jgi:hypothetical protein
MVGSFEKLDPVDPVRRRILQGAVSAALSLAIPRTHHRSEHRRKPDSSLITVNQVGFLPGERKRAVVAAPDLVRGGKFLIVKNSDRRSVCYGGGLTVYERTDGEDADRFQRHFFADFDRFSRPGVYRIVLSDGQTSAPFAIGGDVYRRLNPLLLRYFEIQRCGGSAAPSRSHCHSDDGVIDGGPRDGQRIDASGGWHDAGDYLKFVETTSYVTAVMLFAYERMSSSRFSSPATTRKLPDTRHATPGAGHNIDTRYATPDSLHAGLGSAMLQQARVGLEWLLRMHPAPNEFYYQVGSEEDHNSWRLPEDDSADQNPGWRPRPVYFGVGANLAGRCAAAFAMASRIFRESDPNFAIRCGRAAESVFALGVASQEVLTTRPASFYPEKSWEDDMEWGAVELFRATGNAYYLNLALDYSRLAGPAGAETSVYSTHAIAHHTLFQHAPRSHRDRLLQYLRADAELVRGRTRNPYGLATPYVWGTAEAAVGGALNCLLYSELSRHDDCVDLARKQRDYVLGCNPFEMSYVIGAGSRYPLYPHHQIANIKRIELTGALVGGPATAAILNEESIDLTTPSFSSMNTGPLPPEDWDDEACVYHDCAQDYVTNEPANDYTAKFLLLNTFYC